MPVCDPLDQQSDLKKRTRRMGELHELIVRHGRQAAADISPRRQRTHIEIAARILEEENNALGGAVAKTA
jgi:hypothetical protein